MPTLPAKDGKVLLAPHTVILGAGARIAAYLDWGRTGPKLPSMQDLTEVLSLNDELVKAGFGPKAIGFEALYDDLATTGQTTPLPRSARWKLLTFVLRTSSKPLGRISS
jgi:hypothetical protein